MRAYSTPSIIIIVTSLMGYVACGDDDNGGNSDNPGGSANEGGTKGDDVPGNVAGNVSSGGRGNVGGEGSTPAGGAAQGDAGATSMAGAATVGGATGESGAAGSIGGSGGDAGLGGDTGTGGDSGGMGPVNGGANSGGTPAGGTGAGPGGGTTGTGGAGPDEPRLPAACPGVLADYNIVEGTSANETFGLAELTAGNDFLHARGGDDTLQSSIGDDCYLGANGVDRLEHGIAGDGTDVLIGGPESDSFVLVGAVGSADIVDFGSGGTVDSVVFVRAAFGLSGAPAGAIPEANRQQSAVNVTPGADGALCAAATPCIIYDSTDGQVLFDADGSSAGFALLVAKIRGFQNLVFDWANFKLE